MAPRDIGYDNSNTHLNPMTGTLTFVMIAFALATAGVLLTGIVSMLRGGEFNRRYGNKLMRARVILQGITLALLVILFLAR